MKKYIEIFTALDNETRLRILRLLSKANSELCCCELTDSLEEPQYNISRHLRILRYAGLIKERKEGRWVYFSIPKRGNKFREMVIEIISTLPETQRFKSDRRNLVKRLGLREGNKCVLGIQKDYLMRRTKK